MVASLPKFDEAPGCAGVPFDVVREQKDMPLQTATSTSVLDVRFTQALQYS